MPTETNLSELKINVLTKEQYNSATKDANQVYMITDEEDTVGSKNVWYGTCTTAAATAEKIVTTDTGNFTLTAGNVVYVLFNTANTNTSAMTLNVDGTGAKSVYTISTTAISQYQIAPKEVVAFVYDGDAFRLQNGSVATTTYYGMTKLSSSTSSTSNSMAATPSAVKSAYDAATTAQTAIDSLITSSTDDITAGVTELATGTLYLVYE